MIPVVITMSERRRGSGGLAAKRDEIIRGDGLIEVTNSGVDIVTTVYRLCKSTHAVHVTQQNSRP